MNDPHVQVLYYKVVTKSDVDYKNAPPLSEETDDFEFSIDGEVAVFNMKKHYSGIEEAKEYLKKYLRAWEILIGLEHDPDELHLRFDHVDIIDRQPDLINKNVINLHGIAAMHAYTSNNVTLHISRGRYPSFPNNFTASPDVETMYFRYKAFRQNREPLTSMAYMCLTILEIIAGNRKKAAEKYCIDPKILDLLGKLCSTKGDITEARKFPKNRTFIRLNQRERDWIIAVIKKLIRRVGEYTHGNGVKLRQITLRDFPQITI
jgi:hypothetical protein